MSSVSLQYHMYFRALLECSVSLSWGGGCLGATGLSYFGGVIPCFAHAGCRA